MVPRHPRRVRGAPPELRRAAVQAGAWCHARCASAARRLREALADAGCSRYWPRSLTNTPWRRRVNMVKGVPYYALDKTNDKQRLNVPKLLAGKTSLVAKASAHLFQTGVALRSEINTNGLIMVATSMCYLVIQIPAFVELSKCVISPQPNPTHVRTRGPGQRRAQLKPSADSAQVSRRPLLPPHACTSNVAVPSGGCGRHGLSPARATSRRAVLCAGRHRHRHRHRVGTTTTRWRPPPRRQRRKSRGSSPRSSCA